MNRDALLTNLRDLLRQALDARFSGGAHGKLTRATSYADGYMKALLDSGVIGRGELLALVGEERRHFIDAELSEVQPDADRNAA